MSLNLLSEKQGLLLAEYEAEIRLSSYEDLEGLVSEVDTVLRTIESLQVEINRC